LNLINGDGDGNLNKHCPILIIIFGMNVPRKMADKNWFSFAHHLTSASA